ncbi:hypothetical protein TASIC1_0012003300 [Trichoderma asperellum]|uniref:Uncharacterized protein n=1 Tax=Trichoderma asperellum TaxID=101201 RepID=A0A6V8R392_TRIAP|nr:hypothetical protein TASIC1_0012003300 [Trichoderma asperellum]
MEYVRNTGDERLVLVTGRLHAGTAGGMQGSGQDSAVEQAMMAAKPAGQSSAKQGLRALGTWRYMYQGWMESASSGAYKVVPSISRQRARRPDLFTTAAIRWLNKDLGGP